MYKIHNIPSALEKKYSKCMYHQSCQKFCSPLIMFLVFFYDELMAGMYM